MRARGRPWASVARQAAVGSNDSLAAASASQAWLSGAVVGAHVSCVEDSEAVIRTFKDAIDATGTPPLALLLDGKPSNHTHDVHDALGDTLLIPATPNRAQSKAHCEGAFGLLKPTLEGLVLTGDSTETLAASYLANLVTAVGRVLNHRHRADRGGRSRVDLLTDQPTLEEVDQARQALAERLRRQEEARRTLAARQDPVVRATLADAYQRLGLDDPTGSLLTATARYPLNAVLEAIAIFEARRRTGTLPERADARYLLGIARNLTAERETWEIALALWDARVAAGLEPATSSPRVTTARRPNGTDSPLGGSLPTTPSPTGTVSPPSAFSPPRCAP
jgi:hypothetical protein